MMSRITVMARLSVVLTATVVALPPTSALCASKQETELVMIPAIAIGDADASSGEVSAVTSKDLFARIGVSPETAISKGGTVVALAQIKKGSRVTCKGNWESGSNVFKAAYVFVGKTVSDSEVGDRVAAACRKIAAAGMASSRLSPPIPASTHEPAVYPQSEEPPSQVRAELLPQLRLSDWEYHQYPFRSAVTGFAKNLTDHPITELVATAHFYTNDGRYIVSSMPNLPVHGESRRFGIPPGREVRFIIRTDWVPDAYPELPTKCIVEFTCTNLGDLRTSPSECGLIAKR